MNEELKIIIKAITDEAQKQIEGVKKKLNETKKEGEETGKKLSQSFSTMGKAAAVAVGAIAAVTTAMVAFGKKAQEVNQGISRLNSTFESMGSSSAQATDTYRELFGIFGEHDRAVETAQSLARVTTEADKLAEYYDILAGAAAKYGDGLQGEALAEQISETIASGKAVGDLARVLVEAGISEDAFNNSLAQTTSLEERELLVRNTLNQALGATGAMYRQNNAQTEAYNKSQADLNIALAQASKFTTPLLTALNQLSATLLTNLAPAFRTIILYVTAFIEILTEAISWVGALFGAVGSSSSSGAGDMEGYQKAMEEYTQSLNNYYGVASDGAEQANKDIEALKKQTMGFDELNTVSSGAAATASVGAAGGSGGALPTAPNPSDFGLGGSLFDTEQFQADLEEVKAKLAVVLSIVGLVASAIGIWKLTNFIKDLKSSEDKLKSFQGSMKTVGGWVMIIAGAMLLIDGYADAWVNGLDWANLLEIITGIGLVVGGLALAFGPLAAAIGLIAGGIALVVIGIKDFVENGYSMEAVIAIAVGAITILVGVIWAFNSALLANPITWIVVAIMALVAAFVILWNDCDAFRQFWIDLWEGIKTVFKAVWEWLKQAAKDIAQFFVDAWEAIKSAWSAVKQWFADVWQGIVNVFTAVGTWFADIFKKAWEGIKTAWSAVKQWFSDLWVGIKNVFSAIGSWFSNIFTNAWTGIKNAWSGVKNWFKDIWKGIKDAFGSVGSWFKDTFKGAWEGVKNVFSTGGKIFDGIKDGISGVFKTVVNGIIKGINKVIKVPFNAINGMLNKIRNVNIAGVKPFSSFWKESPLSVPQIPLLAKGGIVDSATLAMIGERGKEAVVPLENNTEWIDSLAERLAAKQNTPSKIVLMLDGKELGYAAINSINSITKQTGALQLTMI